MTSAIGWYGPLIDLSDAASHIGDFVQLLVFVHRSTPLQYKLSKGGDVIRTDILVGDDTRPFFSVTLWNKRLGTLVVAGDVVLLQNVKVTKFGYVMEARTVECSSLVPLVNPYELLVSKGVDDLVKDCRVGKTTIEKLRKVINWAQRAVSAQCNVGPNNIEQKRQLSKNWRVAEHSEPLNLCLLSEVSCLSNSCKAMFNASIGEVFLPITWRALGESEKEKMFVSHRINNAEGHSIIEDFICTGCQLCGSPLDSENGCIFKQKFAPLFCPKSSNHLHVISFIYRPFMLYVWDESEYLPLLVRNKAAELLFGNITANRVYSCYREQKNCQKPDKKDIRKENNAKAAGKFVLGSCSTNAEKNLQVKEGQRSDRNINFHLIWLIVLKLLLQQGKNTRLKFEAIVNVSLDSENGKFEMVSVSLPCIK